MCKLAYNNKYQIISTLLCLLKTFLVELGLDVDYRVDCYRLLPLWFFVMCIIGQIAAVCNKKQ